MPLLYLLAIAGGQHDAAAQVLDKAQSEITTRDVASSSGAASSSGDRRSNDCCSDEESSSAWGNLFEPVALGVGVCVSAPYWAPYRWLDDSFDVPGRFPMYPYFDGEGYVVLDEFGPQIRSWSVETQVEYGTAFRDLDKIGFYARLNTTARFDFDARFDEWTEERAWGAEHLSLGRMNALFRFAQNTHVLMRSGVGVSWMVGQEAAAGFNFHYGAQFFPAQPLVASAEINWGTLGHAPVFESRATLGCLWRGCEIYTGYDWTFVGSADLHAAIFGIKLYF